MQENCGVSFHGEVGIVRADLLGVTAIPDGAQEQLADSHGRLLVAHSESGHHHYVDAAQARFYEGANGLCFLSVTGDFAVIQQAKPRTDPDRHQDQKLTAPLYLVRRAREQTPEGFWAPVRD